MYNKNIFLNLEGVIFLMKKTIEEKLEMCKEHVVEGKSLSHICELHNTRNIDDLKYLVNLYKRYGEEPFLNREIMIYRRATKLLTISRIKNGESIRQVSLDIGLINYKTVLDWVKKYDTEGEQSIQDTYPRKNYLNEDERYKKMIDKKLMEENERLKAEIDFLKKSQSLAKKLEELTTKEKVKVVNELRIKYELKVLLEMADIPLSVYYYQLNAIKNKVNYRRYNSYKGDLGGVKENVLNQDFKATKPYEKAGTDAKLEKVLNMIKKLKENHQENIKGMIIQSDQGVQYQNSRYSELLNEYEIIQSMNRKGNCLDNSPTENFFGRLKEEIWYNKEYKYENSVELIKEIHNYIKYYNEIRIVTKLKTTPIDFRKKCLSELGVA